MSGETSFHPASPSAGDTHQKGDDPVREDGSPSRASPSGAAQRKSKHRNISRVDNAEKRMHSWRVDFRRRNESVIRIFSDGVHGGKEEALAAAIAYRDQLLSCHSYLDHQIWKRTRLRKDNTSGIPGVGRYKYIDPRSGYRNAFWRAVWADENGLRREQRYYVSRYGEVQAKRLAIAERERQLFRVCKIKAKHTEVQRDLFDDLDKT